MNSFVTLSRRPGPAACHPGRGGHGCRASEEASLGGGGRVVTGHLIETELGAVVGIGSPAPLCCFVSIRESEGPPLPIREGSCLVTGDIWGRVQLIMPPRVSAVPVLETREGRGD